MTLNLFASALLCISLQNCGQLQMISTGKHLPGRDKLSDKAIGIPAPAFGIDETYRRYDSVERRNPDLVYTENQEGGFYTHYVDNTFAACAQTIGGGTSVSPLCSIPASLPAGSVVEVHHGANASGPSGEVLIGGVGTFDRPIFIRGVNMPRMNIALDVGFYHETRYLIIEGLSFYRGSVTARRDLKDGGAVFNNSHIAIRKSDFHGDLNGGGFGVASYSVDNTLSNVVLYDNEFHDNGEWDPTTAVGDQDNHGIAVGGVSYIWILGNKMYHNSGDGLQINGGQDSRSTHHIYVGSNVSHHNKQSGMWTKTAEDVIFSQNEVYGHRTSSSSGGPGLGFQYDPKRVWFLFNTSYDNEVGWACGSGNLGNGDEIYVIGNIFRDNISAGMSINGASHPSPVQIIGNTIVNNPRGIANGYYKVKADIINNIISGDVAQIEMKGEYRSDVDSTMSNNLFVGALKVIWGNTYTNLMNLQSVTQQCSSCLVAGPQFVDAASGNYQLASGSPAIDAGRATPDVFHRFDEELYDTNILVDFNGEPRPRGGNWDIGALEFGSTR